MDITNLSFKLQECDGWPPVSVECLPFKVHGKELECLVAPLFVKGISVGDKIIAEIDVAGEVKSWRTVFKSKRSVVWLLRLNEHNNLETVLSSLRDLGCNTVNGGEFGIYSIDIPPNIGIRDVDSLLSNLDRNGSAVAFPSFRH